MANYRSDIFRDFIAIAKALGDENRVRVLMLLRSGELCLCQIIEMLQLAPSTVSKHMAILHQAGLVEGRKQGRWIYYRLPPAEAPGVVGQTMRWVQMCLGEDKRIAEDFQRLKAVRKIEPAELCAVYRA
jgi:DNA-binding transcriptional ArsR family regulator